MKSNFRFIISGFILAFITSAYTYEKNDGMLWFSALTVSFIFPLAFGIISFHSKLFQRLSVVFLSLTIFLAIFWIPTIYISDYQSKIARGKIEKIKSYIKDYKTKNGVYPKNLNSIPDNLKKTWLGVYPKPLNIYEFNDSIYRIGWDLADHRVYYKGWNFTLPEKNNFYYREGWIDNREIKF